MIDGNRSIGVLLRTKKNLNRKPQYILLI